MQARLLLQYLTVPAHVGDEALLAYWTAICSVTAYFIFMTTSKPKMYYKQFVSVSGFLDGELTCTGPFLTFSLFPETGRFHLTIAPFLENGAHLETFRPFTRPSAKLAISR
jgi:hypothetical protein